MLGTMKKRLHDAKCKQRMCEHKPGMLAFEMQLSTG